MSLTDLGPYLRARRARLDPAALGLPRGRRRTPGLRREEVAARAAISATWYGWLEQGRGGAPSAAVLDRLARALLLTEAEREHLFLLGLGRPPAMRYQAPGAVSPRLQRVLDAMETSPALIITVTWDVIAWNAAAAAVLNDYAALPETARNVMRRLFLDPRSRADNLDWEDVARFVVGVFRAGIARAGAQSMVAPLVEELSRGSADFARLWQARDVASLDAGIKRLRHPMFGEIALEYSAFAVDGRPDLTMLVFTPVGQAARIGALNTPG